MIRAGLEESLSECFNRHIYHIFQDLFLWDMADYHNVLLVNYQIGGLFSLLSYLLKNECVVSDEQAAAFQVELYMAIQKLAHLD